jgi:DNA-binding beta-propeller fold protein YncE
MVLSDDGKQLNDIGLGGRPWGIVVVPDKEEAIVTLANENFIQIINTSTMRHFFIQKVFLNRTQTCFEWLI